MNSFESIDALDFSIFQYDHEQRIYPNWMVRHFESLALDERWHYFRSFRKLEEQLYRPEYLIDQLKWLLKSEPIELEYDFYVQLMCDPEIDMDELFKPGYFEVLDQKYGARFDQAYEESLKPAVDKLASLPDVSRDSLPF